MIAHIMIPLHASQLSQDKSLHVLFDLMTNAWGQDPAAAEEHPEDDDEDLGPGAVEDPDLAEDSRVSGPGCKYRFGAVCPDATTSNTEESRPAID